MTLTLAEIMATKWELEPNGRIACLRISQLQLKLTARDDGTWLASTFGTGTIKAGEVPVVDSRLSTLRLAQVAAAEYLLSLLDEGARQVRAAIREAQP